ncbi:phage integrase SAM-like domain-containing protein [Parabacteroides sp. PF5-9]|uniref:phage integrase SAM-like domain-containing protein n=1 Tax=Parabacteroides sp. PF5-9 TaxID=1742404 RepID=UPI00247443FC|nr:phage integrase SAM-like domain-containing protein [Parabacteroides sp. PF5-9]MDH6357144.1 integrase [Parabacteroides sp. PF5-9]
MASFKFSLYAGNSSQKGCPIKLVIRKNNERKVIALNLYAHPHQWDEDLQRYKTGRGKDLHPDRTQNNEYLNRKEVQAHDIVEEFDRQKIDWTLTQFEDTFLHKTYQSNVSEFFTKLVSDLKATGHDGNAECYQRTLEMLCIFDSEFNKRIFSEINLKYVRAFDVFLQKPRISKYKKGGRIVQREGCCGNTRKYYHKALRAAYNKAISEGDADERFYPYGGRSKFEVNKLTETTAKRYLSDNYIETIKTTSCENVRLEIARRLFLFSYYCHGISYIDMALLSTKNIYVIDNDKYLVYKRYKLRNNNSTKPLYVKITPELEVLIDWFKHNTLLTADYLTPCVTKDYSHSKLYSHIKNRRGRYNDALKRLGKDLGIELNLTTYVSRHSVAMRLRNSNVSTDKISQVLGHGDVKTTEVYLDSFGNRVIDEVVRVL